MTGGEAQRARVLEQTLRARIAEDAKWFAARHAELAQMRADRSLIALKESRHV